MRNAMRVRDRHTLRAYLQLMALSERGLAARAGVGHATVNHLLSGRRTTCAPGTAAAIERALGCPPGLFFVPSRLVADAAADLPRRGAGASIGGRSAGRGDGARPVPGGGVLASARVDA